MRAHASTALLRDELLPLYSVTRAALPCSACPAHSVDIAGREGQGRATVIGCRYGAAPPHSVMRATPLASQAGQGGDRQGPPGTR